MTMRMLESAASTGRILARLLEHGCSILITRPRPAIVTVTIDGLQHYDAGTLDDAVLQIPEPVGTLEQLRPCSIENISKIERQ